MHKRAKAIFKGDTALAMSITAAAQAKFGRQAPSTVDPSLRPGVPVGVKLSYPSKHGVYVFSELAVLSALDPGRRADFQALTDQVAFSRLYAAGHYRSDLIAGALVGDLLGDYEVRALRQPTPTLPGWRRQRPDAPAGATSWPLLPARVVPLRVLLVEGGGPPVEPLVQTVEGPPADLRGLLVVADSGQAEGDQVQAVQPGRGAVKAPPTR